MANDYPLDMTIARSRDGWQVETMIPLGYDRRELQIHTWSKRGELWTQAQVVQMSEDTGTGFVGRSFVLFQDYNKVIGRVPGRGTEKSLKAAHLAALRNVGSIMLEARAHHPDPAATVAA